MEEILSEHKVLICYLKFRLCSGTRLPTSSERRWSAFMDATSVTDRP